MIDEALLDRLSSLYPALAGLTSELRARVLSRSLPLNAPAGARLFGIGDRCAGFAALSDGVIRVSRPLPTGRTVVLYRVRPGGTCVVSLASMLGHRPALARAIVERDARGASIPADVLVKVVDSSPQFRAFAFSALGERLAEVIQLVEQVVTQPLQQRIAGLLAEKPALWPMTHRGIADELGSVREVVSRILGDFERRGLVELERGRIRILDRERLEEIATVR